MPLLRSIDSPRAANVPRASRRRHVDCAGGDWVTISSLATAGGTLALAVSTFASVRSANRAARVAERALLVGLRPLVVTSRMDDPEQKIGYADSKWVKLPGGGGVAEVSDEAVYLAISLRNVGSGIAVLDGWRFAANRSPDGDEPPPVEEFHRPSRDIYVPTARSAFGRARSATPEVTSSRTPGPLSSSAAI